MYIMRYLREETQMSARNSFLFHMQLITYALKVMLHNLSVVPALIPSCHMVLDMEMSNYSIMAALKRLDVGT